MVYPLARPLSPATRQGNNPAALPTLLEPVLSRRADLSIGSRCLPGAAVPDWDRRRRLLSYCGNLYTRLWLGFPVRDATAGFRAYRAETLRAVGLRWVRSGYAFQIEMTVLASRCGARIVEVPIRFADRDLGRSKMSGPIVAEAILLVTWWGIRRRLPPLAGIIRRLVRRLRRRRWW